ncbi:MAG: LrgB family protein [Acidithiobacillus ferriphilus]
MKDTICHRRLRRFRWQSNHHRALRACHGLHRHVHWRSRVCLAWGASWGAAAHAIGTAADYARDEEAGAVASLTMVIAGIGMILIAPFLSRFMG